MFFSNNPKPLLSVFNCSTMCQCDLLKVLFKKMSGRGPSGVSKLTFLRFGTGSGLDLRIFCRF